MVFEKVREFLASQLEISEAEINLDTDIFEDLGADSLDLVELMMALEDEYGTVITDEGASGLRTVRQVVEFIESII